MDGTGFKMRLMTWRALLLYPTSPTERDGRAWPGEVVSARGTDVAGAQGSGGGGGGEAGQKMRGRMRRFRVYEKAPGFRPDPSGTGQTMPQTLGPWHLHSRN
jgi:hypothetical protein